MEVLKEEEGWCKHYKTLDQPASAKLNHQQVSYYRKQKAKGNGITPWHHCTSGAADVIPLFSLWFLLLRSPALDAKPDCQ
jgi:hypothetical protein